MKTFIIVFVLFVIIIIFIVFKSFRFPVLIRKAEEYIKIEDYSRASEIVKKILEKKKDYVPARYIKAQLFMRQNQYLLAISELNNILAITDFNKFVKELEIHYHLADLYNKTKNWPKEIEEYKIILFFDPQNIKANHRIGHAYFQKNNYKKAMEHLNIAILQDTTLVDCYVPLGISFYELSEFDNSEQYLLKSLKGPGDHTEVEFYLGSIYKIRKDYENAERMLESSLKNRKFFVKSLYALGENFYDQHDFKKSIEYLEKGLNNISDGSDEANNYRFLLAECFEIENKIEESIHHWKKIAESTPNFRNVEYKIKSYNDIVKNENLMYLFNLSLEKLQSIVVEIISDMNYNIVHKKKLSNNIYQFKAYNIKRINDPPQLINFSRTTRDITEGQILEFYDQITSEKCKSGMFLSTSKFNSKAENASSAKMIELYDSDFIVKAIEKIKSKKKVSK